ncbi:MAG TPA: DUF2892 domain-containing protein [Candidatus Acidoferrales bacterium]|nr:DUF2892 domain-containing protein [Candidatus Acidoferrales bacterium]
MPHNVGGVERGIRIVAGLVLLGVALFHVLVGVPAVIAYVVGGVALLTGLIAYCPAWSVCGINTSKMKEAKADGSRH